MIFVFYMYDYELYFWLFIFFFTFTTGVCLPKIKNDVYFTEKHLLSLF